MRICKSILCLLLIFGMAVHIGPVPTLAAETAPSLPSEAPTVPAESETTAPEQTTPETEGTVPETEETVPETEESVPETEETVPETEESVPETEETVPETDPAAMSSQSGSMSFESPDPKDDPHWFPGYDRVPLMFQTDYPLVPYSDGTLYTSGCTMACVAMVGSWLRQEEILPDELARRFGKYDASNIQRMEAASTVLDLKYTTTFLWWDVEQALRQGKVVIALVDAAGFFTDTQHTIVLRGITTDGRILVHDPYEPNYQSYWLEEGFKNGFDPWTIREGFSQAWIYEGYCPPPTGQSRYPDIQMTQEERDLLAKIIYLEARGESFRGQQAIAEIVFNRIASGKFNTTVKGTLLAEGQFSTVKFLEDAEPGELQYKAIDMALSGPNVLPMDVYFFGRKVTNDRVWGRIDGHVFCYGNP